jgi:hypothetical protein
VNQFGERMEPKLEHDLIAVSHGSSDGEAYFFWVI